MSKEDRAKQFMPFAALKGYPDALRKRERVIVPKMELSEDYKELLDLKFKQIRKNDIITVIYFDRHDYIKKTGIVSGIDPDARILRIVNTKIAFSDIYDIICM